MAAIPYPDRDGFVAQLLSELDGPPAPAAIIELRGGHRLTQTPGIVGASGCDRCSCGLTAAQIEAYGYPTCPASDIIDSTAVEVE